MLEPLHVVDMGGRERPLYIDTVANCRARLPGRHEHHRGVLVRRFEQRHAVAGEVERAAGLGGNIAELVDGTAEDIGLPGGSVDAVVVAHNAPYDVGFLTAACRKHDYTWPAPKVVDTARLAGKLGAPQERRCVGADVQRGAPRAGGMDAFRVCVHTAAGSSEDGRK